MVRLEGHEEGIVVEPATLLLTEVGKIGSRLIGAQIGSAKRTIEQSELPRGRGPVIHAPRLQGGSLENVLVGQ